MQDYQKILSLIDDKSKSIPKSLVLDWTKSDDILVLGALYKLTDKDYFRIKPELGTQVTYDLILKYLTRCMLDNPESSDLILSGYEAAWTLASWFKQLCAQRPTTDQILKTIVSTLGAMYEKGDPAVQDRILNGTLEHIFEQEEAVNLFTSWQTDPVLKLPYTQALQWGQDYWSKS